ncbi:hypothetical protein VIN01S_15120 [Vibrio inusitatus NBRC 102082]|uniref:Lipoprotein n=1 Tax=Vibrio inusitatus NBRC 102082 TaxID=1219070 RepID=A0A4Y3HUH8_9VIBR|nr:hypothetical protein [Vibrio inusitatus]GEA50708.1 hypothetical protein VIN01S_15120 [Vibrio inusitatus NBRC 102082]
MNRLLVASIVGGLALTVSTGTLATQNGEGKRKPPRCENKYECEASATFTLEGEIPCKCKFSLPDSAVIDVFKKQKGPGVRKVGEYSAECNTGNIWLKVRSENGALAHKSIADVYIPYEVGFGAETFAADHANGTPKEYIWNKGDGISAVTTTGGTQSVTLNSIGGGPRLAGEYSDTLTLTVSGLPLLPTP